MRNALLAAPLALMLSGCALFDAANTGQPIDSAQLRQDLTTAALALKDAGCITSVLAAAAAPIVAVTSDDTGAKTLTAISATGAALCAVPAPAAVSSPAGTTLGAVVATP